MINVEHLDALNLMVEEASEYFKDCSVGYRARPCLDGTFPKYHTLKYFAMPPVLRKLVKESCSDFDKNIETYFLKFNEGDSLGMYKCIDQCFFVCKSVLLSGEAVVTKGTQKVEMKVGDTVEVNLNQHHSVTPKSPCVFLIEMQIREDFNGKT